MKCVHRGQKFRPKCLRDRLGDYYTRKWRARSGLEARGEEPRILYAEQRSRRTRTLDEVDEEEEDVGNSEYGCIGEDS